MNEQQPLVISDILAEREKQEAKWGEQNHSPFVYLAILGEEVGEANQAALQAHLWIKGHESAKWDMEKLEKYRKEMVQVAAVAMAMIECYDRQKWIRHEEGEK